jgi:hypothetical protein
MRELANEDFTPGGVNLGVAFQTKIVVTLDEHFVGDRAVGLVADDASFTQRLVLVNDGPGLFAMALCTGFVKAGEAGLRADTQGSAVRSLENVRTVWVVTLDAVHVLFQDGMMMGQLKLGVDLEMTAEAGVRRPAGVDDEFSAATACLDVETSRSVARFTTGGFSAGSAFDVDAHVWAGGKDARELGMTIDARFVAHKICSVDDGGRDFGGSRAQAGTGSHCQQRESDNYEDGETMAKPDRPPKLFTHWRTSPD